MSENTFIGSSTGLNSSPSVQATNLVYIINAGKIAGTPNAINFSGTLELHSTSNIEGYVFGTVSSTLALGGTKNGSFNTSRITPAYDNGIPYGYVIGFFEKMGSSTWTLTGISPAQLNVGGARYWTVKEGTLRGDTSSLQGKLVFDPVAGASVAPNIIFNQSQDGTYAGVISGKGDVTKTGDKKLTLTTAQAFDGEFTNTGGGTLALDLSTNAQILPRTNPLNLAGGTLDFSKGNKAQTLDTTTVTGGSNTISRSGYTGTTANSGVNLGNFSITGGSVDIQGLSAGDINETAASWIRASGLPASTFYISTAVTANGGQDFVGTNSLKNLIVAKSASYKYGATIPAVTDSDKLFVKFASSGACGSGCSGDPISFNTDAYWIGMINAYASDPTQLNLGNHTLHLGVDAPIMANAGADLSITGGSLTAGGTTTNTVGKITITGQNTITINSKIVDNGTTGAVSLQVNGPGTVIVTGDTTHSGGTAILGGELQIGDGQTSNGSMTGDINTGTESTNGILAFAPLANIDLVINDVIFGSGSVNQKGPGVTELTGINTYKGDTTLSNGTLRISTDRNLGVDSVGNPTGTLIFAGGALQTLMDIVTSRQITINDNKNAIFSPNQNTTLNLKSLISGTAGLSMIGEGILALTGSNTYNQGTILSKGTLQISADNNLGADSTGNPIGTFTFDGGTLNTTDTFTTGRTFTINQNKIGIIQPDQNTTLTFSTPISGAGGVEVVGPGHIVFTAANTYGGNTVLSGGRLQLDDNLADGGGSITGNINTGTGIDTGTFAFNRSANVSFSGVISGEGNLEQIGTGATTLTGKSGSFTGTTTVNQGRLRVNGTLGGTTTVNTGATLSGSGTLAGNVTIARGILGVGGDIDNTDQTLVGSLTINGDLELSNEATALFDLNIHGTVGVPSNEKGNDWVTVGGDLTLGGTLRVSGTPTAGYYRLFNYGTFATTPPSQPNGSFVTIDTGTQTFAVRQILTNIPGQVNAMFLEEDQGLQFWDGANTNGSPGSGSGSVDGGDGIWKRGHTNWTGPEGHAGINDEWRQSIAVFAGTAGIITVEGVQSFNSLYFETTAYRVSPDAQNTGRLKLNGTQEGKIRLHGDTETTIDVPLIDGNVQDLAIESRVRSRLNLTQASTYSGKTAIRGPVTLALIGKGGISSSSEIMVSVAAELDISETDKGSTIQSLSGQGKFFLGSKPLTLSNAAGMFAGVIQGNGRVTLEKGTQILSGNNTYRGGTSIAKGSRLQIGDGAELGSIEGDVINQGTLAFKRSNDLSFAEEISGEGLVKQEGGGTLTLSGKNLRAASLTADSGHLVIDGSEITASDTVFKQNNASDVTITVQNGYISSTKNRLLDANNSASLTVNLNNTLATGDAMASGTGNVSVNLVNSSTLTGMIDPLDVNIDASSTWNMTASSTLDTLTHAGKIHFATPSNATNYKTLTMKSYVGQEGSIDLHVAQDAHDQLIIDGGSASGHTGLNIVNESEFGTFTKGNGLALVKVQNGATSTPDAFHLTKPVITAGAYRYRLYYGGDAAAGGPPDDHNWYLRSSLVPDAPDYRPEVPVYLAMPALMNQMGFALLGNHQARMGQESYAVSSAKPKHEQVAWGRVWGQTARQRPGKHTSLNSGNDFLHEKGPRYDYRYEAAQVGIDVWRSKAPNAAHHAVGLYLGQSSLSADILPIYTNYEAAGKIGKVKLQGTSAGLYWTYAHPSGWYADNVLQVTYSKGDGSTEHNRVSVKGRGLVASIETGYAMALNKNWLLTPEVQALYQHGRLSGVKDNEGYIAFGKTDIVRGRVGTKLSYQGEEGVQPLSLAARMNIWHDFMHNAPSTIFSTLSNRFPTTVKGGLGGTWAELDLQVQVPLSKSISLYGTISYGHSIDAGRSSNLGGNIGLKWLW